MAVGDWLDKEVRGGLEAELMAIGGSWIRRMFCGSVCCCFCRSLSRLSSEYWDSCCSRDMLSIAIGCRTLQIWQIYTFHICTFDMLHTTCYIISC